jgi:hypothetical protein
VLEPHLSFFEGDFMLDVSQVNRSLDRKTTILWLELIDIFIIVTTASCLNLFFGQTGLKTYLVYLPSVALALTMILTKRGKPDGFFTSLSSLSLKTKTHELF